MKYLLPVILVSFMISSCKEPKKGKIETDQALKISSVLSQLTYCPNAQQTIEKYLPGWKIIWNPEAVGGNYAFLASDGVSYAIAIRGSLLEFSWDAFQNWLYQDFNIAYMQHWDHTINEKNAEIAQGAFDGFNNIVNMKDKVSGKPLLAFLDSLTITDSPILITGHSLGGNLATVYASFLWNHYDSTSNKRSNINIITFGAPAAGNKSFADDFNEKFPKARCIENTNDVVPKFPCTGKMKSLGKLYESSPSAEKISVGYKNLTTTLKKVFTLLNTALILISIKNGGSDYTQPNSNIITTPLSGNNKADTIDDWLKEAAYQHSMEQYAHGSGTSVVSCGQ